MGVAGLWPVLQPAAEIHSLTKLALDKLHASTTHRGFRIGIDASIWFYHADYGKDGENPQLRTLFFRCAQLLKAPFLPLFVFDGPHRPVFKRGKQVNRQSHKLTNGMKAIIEAFGFEHRTAPGEAEAELAYLNSIGVIDGILSDDVDTFVFGACKVIRNVSNNLTGNASNPVLNADSRDDKNHARVFTIDNIRTHPEVQLDRAGLILVALCSGGDYNTAGLTNCGPKIAAGLARAGLGTSLWNAATTMDLDELHSYLYIWRDELREELRTNKSGCLPQKRPSLAKEIPDTFPPVEILRYYVNPTTSANVSLPSETLRPAEISFSSDPSIPGIARICEQFFEWGFEADVVKRFRTVIWWGVVMRLLRRAVIAKGDPTTLLMKHFTHSSPRSTPRCSLNADGYPTILHNIHGTRTHPSTDNTPEYRLSVDPSLFVALARGGLVGDRRPEDKDNWKLAKLSSQQLMLPDTGGGDFDYASDEDFDDVVEGKGKSKGKQCSSKQVTPTDLLRVWVPASLLSMAASDLVETYKTEKEKKAMKKSGTRRRKGAADDGASSCKSSPVKPKAKGKTSKTKGPPALMSLFADGDGDSDMEANIRQALADAAEAEVTALSGNWTEDDDDIAVKTSKSVSPIRPQEPGTSRQKIGHRTSSQPEGHSSQPRNSQSTSTIAAPKAKETFKVPPFPGRFLSPLHGSDESDSDELEIQATRKATAIVKETARSQPIAGKGKPFWVSVSSDDEPSRPSTSQPVPTRVGKTSPVLKRLDMTKSGRGGQIRKSKKSETASFGGEQAQPGIVSFFNSSKNTATKSGSVAKGKQVSPAHRTTKISGREEAGADQNAAEDVFGSPILRPQRRKAPASPGVLSSSPEVSFVLQNEDRHIKKSPRKSRVQTSPSALRVGLTRRENSPTPHFTRRKPLVVEITSESSDEEDFPATIGASPTKQRHIPPEGTHARTQEKRRFGDNINGKGSDRKSMSTPSSQAARRDAKSIGFIDLTTP